MQIIEENRKLDRAALEEVAEMFRVFSEATRLAIVQELKSGEHSVNQLVEALDCTQANVSKQLRVLHDAGLLARQKRGNQVFYSINDDVIFPLCELVCDKLNRDARARSASMYAI